MVNGLLPKTHIITSRVGGDHIDLPKSSFTACKTELDVGHPHVPTPTTDEEELSAVSNASLPEYESIVNDPSAP